MSDPRPTPLAVPPALKPGDGISVVAPASSPKRKRFEAAMENLAAAGYRPKVYRDLCDSAGYLSGTDAERADELEQAFRDPETTMVLAARGGYGCGRILDRVDFSPLAERPKIVCGYSDLTALHAAIQKRCGLVSFHAPNLVDGLGDTDAETVIERDACDALFAGRWGAGTNLLAADADATALVGGHAVGRLIGGNLAVFGSLLGTPDQPDFAGAVMLLEDVHESPHRIDRMLNQLRISGLLSGLAGAVLGYFSDSGKDSRQAVESVLRGYFEPLGIPVLWKARIGHEHPNLPLPLGTQVRLEAGSAGLWLTEPVVRS